MKYKKRPLCLLLTFLLCFLTVVPAFAGGGGVGTLTQDGTDYVLSNDQKGADWSFREYQNGKLMPELTLNNCTAEYLGIRLDADVTIVLANGSVNKVAIFNVEPTSESETLIVKGNGTLIIGESFMEQSPLDFIVITDGATVTVSGQANNDYGDEFYETDDEPYEPAPVIEEPPQPDDAGNEDSWNLPFTDVSPDAYYADAVKWAVENGITNGVSETNFAPDETCNRGQVATFLWRAKGCPEPVTTVNPFTDVEPSSAFYKAILWAWENGITAGTSDTTFSPGNPCTRAHVVTFLWRAQGKPEANGPGTLADSFPQGYYTDAVRWADGAGLLSGTAEAFAPSALCPRADIVTYLYRNLA